MLRLRYSLLALAAVMVGGTVGFELTEGQDLLTSVYFTVITLTTVGYGDVTPRTPGGQVVAMFTILAGVVSFGMLVGSLTEIVVEGQLRRILGRRKLEKDIAALRNHFIVCGFGRIGSIVCREFHQSNVPFVVVEYEDEVARRADEEGYLYLIGDATDDDVLTRAGIMRARGLIAVLASDADNVFVTMSARDLNRSLVIVARGEDDRTSRKLARAGASRVVSPYEIGGLRMAHAILRPNVIDFVEAATRAKTEIDMDEFPVGDNPKFVGKTLADSGIRQEFGLIIVAIRKPDGRMAFNPSHTTRIEEHDVLITMGPEKDQQRLAESLR
jgi:voltage-gated potassium channel